jgi:hypothetical protein
MEVLERFSSANQLASFFQATVWLANLKNSVYCSRSMFSRVGGVHGRKFGFLSVFFQDYRVVEKGRKYFQCS